MSLRDRLDEKAQIGTPPSKSGGGGCFTIIVIILVFAGVIGLITYSSYKQDSRRAAFACVSSLGGSTQYDLDAASMEPFGHPATGALVKVDGNPVWEIRVPTMDRRSSETCHMYKDPDTGRWHHW